MVQTPSDTELVAVLQEQPQLDFELPDPEDEAISEHEFQQRLDNAWLVCDRFDLQTEIWRGRILRAIRDREKKGGDGRGTGFLNWLKQREITKSQAYSLIQLANSADTLIEEGHLQPEAVRNFSKRAFLETAKSAPEVQQLVTEAAQKGDRITCREVRQLADEWTAMSSDLLPDEVKQKAAAGTMPPRYLAPLVKELGKLPDSHITAIQEEVAENPDVDTVKQATTDARYLAKYLDAAIQVQALNQSDINLEKALEEALRLGCLSTASEVVKQAAQLEQAMVKLYNTWKRLSNVADRLYVDTGASTPHLRSLLSCLENLTNDVIEVPMDEMGDRTVRLQILSDTEA
ncbi:hypothetical protein H6G20_25730 [Desertifilum sp. FACHB-1129]|uniref:DUF3102 domain-containing protein n=1 Tax=Desertifilum tharense IPPAS B-1220 TaxID=1781255 RepID=A0A1E5QG92_9CYAN|nr:MULTISPECIES: hypothetical protein [Desertifilum]MDA0209270.1 hypothetical protein [Cyanobacteria bacterium FC1]MBD2315071.1 hypothetical protein [Desertifilum sp. FACHB-1129]MBD2323333.1 hypothetical protein [Desertifilum sp. FACHB-866]MBD2333178.1 hypothetical protein [Desertifilum sp. FACHB-868]OEJ73607.1 hypothetical protein BH720_18855 [Desertifilum tharense IPPAS B-1220]